jgi:hypothetical protein
MRTILHAWSQSDYVCGQLCPEDLRRPSKTRRRNGQVDREIRDGQLDSRKAPPSSLSDGAGPRAGAAAKGAGGRAARRTARGAAAAAGLLPARAGLAATPAHPCDSSSSGNQIDGRRCFDRSMGDGAFSSDIILLSIIVVLHILQKGVMQNDRTNRS